MENTSQANLDASEIQDIAIYNNGDLAFFDNLKKLDVTKAYTTDFYVFILVQEGKASLNINGNHYVAYKNDLCICPPNNIVDNCMLSIDFKCHCVGMSPEYVRRIVPMADNSWDIKIMFERNPVCSLLPKEVQSFCQYYDLICSKVSLPQIVQGRVIDSLMLAFIYDAQYILSRMIKSEPRPFTSGEYLFKKFVEFIESSYPKSRNVAFYADHLHVSPKYLSIICKAACGKTASYLIDHYVMKDIEHLMKHSLKSIKEISNELEFPNISFFGKYVKNHFGYSPKVLREKFRQDYTLA